MRQDSVGIRLALLPYQNHLSGFPSLQIHGKGIGIMKPLQVLLALFAFAFLPTARNLLLAGGL
ncbi:hypothetical protein N9132_00445 [bacterium]|nr:hypothetical protein [bacterium]